MAIEVLLVDDDLDLAMMLRTHLRGQDFQIRSECRGEDGIRSCQENPPDVVILDLLLSAGTTWAQFALFHKKGVNPIKVNPLI